MILRREWIADVGERCRRMMQEFANVFTWKIAANASEWKSIPKQKELLHITIIRSEALPYMQWCKCLSRKSHRLPVNLYVRERYMCHAKIATNNKWYRAKFMLFRSDVVFWKWSLSRLGTCKWRSFECCHRTVLYDLRVWQDTLYTTLRIISSSEGSSYL